MKLPKPPNPQETPAQRQGRYIGAQLAPFRGGVVVEARAIGVFGEPWPALVVTCPDGRTRTLVIQRDDEGNGPGAVSVTDHGPTRPEEGTR